MTKENDTQCAAITEQGDLGLGITPIDESVFERETENKEKEKSEIL